MKLTTISFGLLLLNIQFILAQKWEVGTPLPDSAIGRHHPVTFSVDGYGYVGMGNGPDSALDDFYKYDPIADSWTTLKKFPGGKRGFSIGIEHLGKGWVGFGLNENNQLMTDLWEYNPFNDSWTKRTNCPCEGRYHPAFLALAGKLYVGLGSGDRRNLKDWWEYDILSDTWTQKADFPSAQRHHPYQFSLFPYAYVGMGHGAGIYNDLYRYDPSTNEWTEMKLLPGEGRVAGTQFSYNGKGYVLSGQGEDHDYMDDGEFYEFDPASNDWIQLPPHPKTSSRWAPGSFVIGDKAYFTCGQDRLVYNKDVLVYNFSPVNTKNLQEEKIEINPNPSNLNLQISAGQTIMSAQISGLNGNIIKEIQNPNTMSQFIQIDLTELSSGIYFVKAKLKDGRVAIERFIKK